VSHDIVQRLKEGGIRYSQVWEDHRLLERGLDIDGDDDVLSICSAGDNALALLLQEPRSVTTIDLNPAQSALLELKLAGIRRLEHDEFACLVGARDGHDRVNLYERVRDALLAPARAYWDAHTPTITSGIMNCGRLETYIHHFHSAYVSRFLERGALAALLDMDDPEQQEAAFERTFTPEFVKAFRSFFGRDNMAREGRDPAQFAYVGGIDVGAFLWDRFRYACTRLPLRGNFYVEYCMTFAYRDLAHGPPYLQPRNFDTLKRLVDRVQVVTGDLGSVLAEPHRFSKANLSDLFEYLSAEVSDELMQRLARALRKGGRFAYWNLLVPRASGPALRGELTPKRELADSLWRGDRSWFYSAFQIEEVV
jgi:S-adenosylmethionine-diacylglycerol 3-amino-3-carboxypropyl transferase